MLSRASKAYLILRSARNHWVIRTKRLSRTSPKSYVSPSSWVARDLVAEEYVFVGPRCTIPPLVSIGRYTMLAAGVAIVGDDHQFDQVGVPTQFTGRPHQQQTCIGSDVWLGQNAIILRGVTIGDGAIVGAGAVVTKDIPAYEVWAGTPARWIRDRFDSEGISLHAAMLAGPLQTPSFVQPLAYRPKNEEVASGEQHRTSP